MLKPVVCEAAESLGRQLAEEKLELVPIAGTPIAALTALSMTNTVLEASRDTFGVPHAALHKGSTEKAVDGNYPHDALLAQTAAAALRPILYNLDLARNKVNPLVADIHQTVVTYAGERLKDSTSPYAVVVVSPNTFLTSDYLADEVGKYSETPAEDIKLPFTIPEQEAEKLAELVKTGNNPFDESFGEYLSEHRADQLFHKVFTTTEYSTSNYLESRTIEGAATATWVFLAAKRLLEDVPEGINAPLNVYQNALSSLMVQAGRAVQVFLENRARAIKYKSLIVGDYPGSEGVIYVNGDLYDKWLEEGGSPELLFGAAVGSRTKDYNVLLENREDLLATWCRTTTMLASKAQADRFAVYVECLSRALSGYLARNTELGEGVIVQLQAELKEILGTVQNSDLDDVYGLVRCVVCKLLFRNTNALEILTTLDKYAEKNPDTDVGECALLALIDHAVNWVFAQVKVQSV